MPDQILLDIINEHLPYEMDMLRVTYTKLAAIAQSPTAATPENRACRFALIESFCVHARSLVDFFLATSANPNDVLATEFTTGFRSSLDPANAPLRDIRTKLNKQIFHLTKDRTLIDAAKFDPGTDGSYVLNALEAEMRNFIACLRPDFRPFTAHTVPVNVETHGPLGPTNHITSITLVIGPERNVGGPTGPCGP